MTWARCSTRFSAGAGAERAGPSVALARHERVGRSARSLQVAASNVTRAGSAPEFFSVNVTSGDTAAWPVKPGAHSKRAAPPSFTSRKP